MPRRHRNARPRFELLNLIGPQTTARLREELAWLGQGEPGKAGTPRVRSSEGSTAPHLVQSDRRAASAHDNGWF